MNCIFCQIINNEISSYIIYEDDLVKVFLDIKPQVNGHLLMVPKKHYVDILDIDINIIKQMYIINQQMYLLLQKTFQAKGVTFVQNNGYCQEVKHFHIHIIPRYMDDNKLKPKYVNKNIIPLDKVHKQLLSNL